MLMHAYWRRQNARLYVCSRPYFRRPGSPPPKGSTKDSQFAIYSWRWVVDIYGEAGGGDLQGISRTDYLMFLCGLQPIRALSKVGDSMAGLVLTPLAFYQRDGTLFRGIALGPPQPLSSPFHILLCPLLQLVFSMPL